MGKIFSGIALAVGAIVLIGSILWGELIEWDTSRGGSESIQTNTNFSVPTGASASDDQSETTVTEEEAGVLPMVPDHTPRPPVNGDAY